MALCSECGKNIGKELRERLARVNEELHKAGLVYYSNLSNALTAVDNRLRKESFTPTDGPIAPLSPGEYRIHVEVGDGKWLTAAFHEMETGSYELVAYVN